MSFTVDYSLMSIDGPTLSPPIEDTIQSRTPTPRQEGSAVAGPSQNENQQQVAQRSRWQAVLLEAGGIGAAVSEESMRRLKYCLEWLQVRNVIRLGCFSAD